MTIIYIVIIDLYEYSYTDNRDSSLSTKSPNPCLREYIPCLSIFGRIVDFSLSVEFRVQLDLIYMYTWFCMSLCAPVHPVCAVTRIWNRNRKTRIYENVCRVNAVNWISNVCLAGVESALSFPSKHASRRSASMLANVAFCFLIPSCVPQHGRTLENTPALDKMAVDRSIEKRIVYLQLVSGYLSRERNEHTHTHENNCAACSDEKIDLITRVINHGDVKFNNV